tara:strand:+ start:394 stop:513 length:120 start_codon:yes stop_codon:yes gene_type:complete
LEQEIHLLQVLLKELLVVEELKQHIQDLTLVAVVVVLQL